MREIETHFGTSPAAYEAPRTAPLERVLERSRLLGGSVGYELVAT